MLRFSRCTPWKKASPGGRPSKSSRRRTLHEMLEARLLLDATPYAALNLVASQPGTALVTDPSLTFATGIATSPGASGGFSVSDTLLGQSNAYSGDVSGSPFAADAGHNVQVPSPFGQVYNGNANEFYITSPPPPPGIERASLRAPAELLYASLDGSIYGFNSQIGQQAVAAVSVKNAAFTGIAIANNGSADQLYAADALGGKIDVFDTNFSPVTTSGSFTDPNLPSGDVPFNIESLGGDLYVSYATPGAAPAANSGGLPIGLGPGGVVDAFDANGNFLGRIASGSPLDEPWGMAIAPASFGQFAGDLLVANHGDGKIDAFDPTPDKTATTGTSLGTLSDADGKALAIEGLWGLSFGNGDNAGDTDSLYFSAGTRQWFPSGVENASSSPIAVPLGHGLFGSIQVAGTDPLVAVGTSLTAFSGETLSSVLAAFGSADTSGPTATATAETTTSPVATYTATIAWGDGSTSAGTVVSRGNGGYLVIGTHSYSSDGSDDYTVTINDAKSNSATATGMVEVSTATLSAHALTVQAQGLEVNDANVATFTDSGGADPLNDYTATIDWGDGSSVSAGTITPGIMPLDAFPTGPYFNVAGSHTYTATGEYTFTVTIDDSDGSTATVQGTVDVVPATLQATALPVTSNGLTIDNSMLAEFVDTGGSDPLSNYTATIDWGDGVSSAGTIVAGMTTTGGTGTGTATTSAAPLDLNGSFYGVTGSHTYTAAGEYTFTVTIDDSDGINTTVTGTVEASQPTLVAKGLTITGTGLAVDNGAVADFIDTGGSDPLTNYSATIDWGDGSAPTTGTISGGDLVPGGPPTGGQPIVAGANFSVTGSHDYTTSGEYTTTITIRDSDGTSATVLGAVDFVVGTLHLQPVPIESQGLSVNNAVVADFYDSSGPDPITNYSATINWGDGSSATDGTIGPAVMPLDGDADLTGGLLDVTGSHVYASTGTYNFTVTISDTDGTSATVTGSVDVTPAMLEAKAVPIVATGLAVSNATVADFIDTDGGDLLSNYSATIDWGDGTPTSQGTITALILDSGTGTANPSVMPSVIIGGKYYSVEGSHTYAATGDYTTTITISDSDGTSATVTGSVAVSQPTLVPKGLTITGTGLAVDKATVADFIETGGADPLTNYNATIEWGDGTSSAATITGGNLIPGETGGPAILAGAIYYVAGSHSYTATGDYTTTIIISDSDGTSATVSGAVDLAAATLEAHALPDVSQGLNVNNATVADFVDTGGADPLSNYSATIVWGDGSSSTGTIGAGVMPDVIVAGGKPPVENFFVSGSHTYAAAGDYTFTVAISDTDGTNATVTGTVTVATPTLEAKALSFNSQSLSLNDAAVAQFVDTGGADPLANYSATIDWGDNSTSAGTIDLPVGDPLPGATAAALFFHVVGSHTYTSPGDYTFTVTISDTDGTSATVTGTVVAAEPTLDAKVLPVYSSGLTLTNTAIADFADTGGADPVSDYSATINWGDSSSSAGTIQEFVADPPGGPLTASSDILTGPIFQVAGSHTYAAAGDYTLTITITDSDGTSTTVTGTASVAEAPLLAVGVPVVVTSGLSVNNAIVAALTDAAGGDAVSNYSATIDWGDGTSTAAGTVSGSGNSFIVNGSHTYAASGDYQFTVSISDSDGSKAVATAHAYVDAPTASYVASAFQGILHRAADDTGLNYWSQQIASGLAPSQFASDLTHSAEFYATNVIGPAYKEYLGRSADTAGIAYWTSQMQQGLTDQQIEANFIASDEFYAKAGGTDAGWVNAMYQTVLGRSADSAGLSYWLSQLASGVSRADVAMGFAGSQEREGQIIQQDYFTYLGRSASAAEVDYWVAQFDDGATNEDIVSGFVGSPEYVKLNS